MQSLDRNYWCFISYRHIDNKEVGRQWATWLHHQLETYEVPEDLVGATNERGDTIPTRIFPVFRDEDELEPGDLNQKIYRALDSSRVLIVLCSPRVGDSRFVDAEIRHFKRIGKAARIYAAIIEGDPAAPIGSNGCFPDALCYEPDDRSLVTSRRTEPMGADFRLADGSPGWTNAEAYREALIDSDTLSKAEISRRVTSYQERLDTSRLKLIAAVLGVPFGTLQARDKAYQLALSRRKARVLRRWLSAVAALSAAALGAAFYANEQRKEAVRRSLIANSRALSLRAGNVMQEQPDLALLLAAEAFDSFDTYEARAALLSAITYRPNLRLIGHGDGHAVSAMSQSVDGRIVVSGGDDGTVRFWSADTLQSAGVFKVHSAPVAAVAASPTTNVVVTASGDELRFWDLETRAPLSEPLRTELGAVSNVTFSSDGSRCASAHGGGIAIWDTKSFQRIVPNLADSSAASCVAFSQDGALLAAGDYGANVRVWDLANNGRLIGKPISTLQRFAKSVIFSPDGKAIAVGGSNPNVTVWDPRTKAQVGNPLETPSGQGVVVAVEPRSGYIAAGDGSGAITMWPWPQTFDEQQWIGHRGAVRALLFDRSGEFLISAGADGTLIKWSTDDANPLAHAMREGANSVANAHQRDLVAIGGEDGAVSIWDMVRGNQRLQVAEARGSSVRALAFNHTDDVLAALYSEELVLWNLEHHRVIARVPRGGFGPNSTDLTFTSDNRLVISDSGYTAGPHALAINVLDSVTGQVVGKELLIGLKYQNDPFAISADGTLAATAEEKTVTLWRIDTGERLGDPIQMSSGIEALAFSPDRATLAIAGSREVEIWDLRTRTLRGELHAPDRHQIRDVMFAPGGRVLSTSGTAYKRGGTMIGDVLLWDLSVFQPIGQLLQGRQTSPQANTMAFGASGKRLATLGDGIVWRWDLSVESWRDAARRIANRALDANQR